MRLFICFVISHCASKSNDPLFATDTNVLRMHDMLSASNLLWPVWKHAHVFIRYSVSVYLHLGFFDKIRKKLLLEYLLVHSTWHGDTRFQLQFECHCINLLNAQLNPICHLLPLLGAHHILYVSRVRVNLSKPSGFFTYHQF